MLGSAVKYGFLAKNPADGLHVTPAKRGTRRQAIHSTGQFTALVELILEPYATWLRMPGTDPRTGNLSCGIPDSRPQQISSAVMPPK